MFVIQFANKEAVFALVSTTSRYFIMSDEARSEQMQKKETLFASKKIII